MGSFCWSNRIPISPHWKELQYFRLQWDLHCKNRADAIALLFLYPAQSRRGDRYNTIKETDQLEINDCRQLVEEKNG
jgi:hypothetical protein